MASLFWLGAALLGASGAAAADPEAVSAGGQVYEEQCAACHGERLRVTGTAPDLRELGSDQRPRFDEVVLNGRGQMPSWQGVLETEQIDQVWAYVRSIAD